MIYMEKTFPGPPCLEEEKKKKSGTYRHPDVINQIQFEFKNKCYLCEYKRPPSINVEHFVPHRGDPELKFAWINLFFACSHCNNIKGDRYDHILNCTQDEHEVSNLLKYEMDPFPYANPKITPLSDGERVANTAELLNEIYCGHTAIKTAEAENICKELLEEMQEFQFLLTKYYDIEEDEFGDKVQLKKEIIKHLRPYSSFTAFKREIVKKLEYKDFEPYLANRYLPV